MMRPFAWNVLAMVIGLGLVSSATAQVVRNTNGPGPHNILESVVIPSNAEVLALSGVVPQPIDPSKRPDSIEDYGDTKTQTTSVLNQIKATLERRGYKMSDVVRMTVYLTADPKRTDGRMDFQGMNEAYRMFFGTAENPNVVARSTVQVAALAGPFYLVEIEVTAAKAPARSAGLSSGAATHSNSK
jgi:2-iminobutanoate/2-iminopropanoate deaminase